MLSDFNNKIIFYDGAMGTMLQKRGLKSGEMPDLMNITTPDAVEEVHRLYIDAGSNIICTNTFGANAHALRDTEYTPEEIISAAATIAGRAISNANAADAPGTKIALDIGPIGQLIEPYGDLSMEEAISIFAEQAVAGEKAGVDFVAIETMAALDEMEAALCAVRKSTNLPILATMTFDTNGRTYMGVSVADFVELAQRFGASAIGMNCSLEPEVMVPVAKQMSELTNLPLIIKLNAGLPDGETGLYSVGPEEFAKQLIPYGDIGVKIMGGCCGTSPEYIAELRAQFC